MILTVIVIAYNRREYIKHALSSINNQTLKRNEFEVILIKNFIDSDIDSECIKSGVKTILMEGTIGEYIKTGIIESTGEVITFLEDDDEFSMNKLESVITIYKKEKFDFMKNGFLEIDQSENKMKRSVQRSTHLDRPLKKDVILKKEEVQLKMLHFLISRGQDFNLSSMSISRSVANQIGKTIEKIATCPDGAIFLLSLNFGQKFIFSTLKLTYYRIHESRSRSFASMEIAMEKIKNDGFLQSESLLKVRMEIEQESLIRIVDEIISVRNIRTATLSQHKGRDSLSTFYPAISLAISGNIYAVVWIFIFILSKFPLVPIRRVVFGYLKGL